MSGLLQQKGAMMIRSCALRLCTLLVLAAPWAASLGQPANLAAGDAAALQAYFSGRWQAANTCGTRVNLTLDFDKPTLQGASVVMRGKATSGNRIDSVVVGRYDSTNGLLTLDAMLAPDDPDYCPTFKVLGRCINASGPGINSQTLMERHQRERAAMSGPSTFSLEAARDPGGAALTGTIRGPGFDCPAATISRADQAPPVALAPRTAATDSAALGRVDASGAATVGGQARLTWLLPMAGRGDPIAMAELGRHHEQQQPPDFAQAAQWYLKAAQAGEARAQRQLSALYAKGQGVPLDTAQSARWASAAKAISAEVGRYCVAPAMLRAYVSLFDSVKKDPSNVMLGFFATMLTGMSIDEGSFSIEGAGVEAVTLRDGPFVCRIVGRRVGTTARNVKPAFQYAGEDRAGRALFYDNSGDVAMNEAIGSLVTTMASKVQATQAFQVAPLGANRFRVTVAQGMAPTSATHSVDISIDPASLVVLDKAPAPPRPDAPVAPPSASLSASPSALPSASLPPVRGTATARQRPADPVDAGVAVARYDPARERAVWSLCETATTRAMCDAYASEFPNGPHAGQARGRIADLAASSGGAQPRQPTAAAFIDAAGKDDAAMLETIDDGFVQWSGAWSHDSYMAGSAKVDQRRCGGPACQINGTFNFRRMGQTIAAAFTANVARGPDGVIAVRRLCYADRSSGMSDCVDF